MLIDLSMIFKSIDSKSRLLSCVLRGRGGLGQRERPKTLLIMMKCGAMNSFETTGRSVGVQTAVRQKSQSTGDGYVICMT